MSISSKEFQRMVDFHTGKMGDLPMSDEELQALAEGAIGQAEQQIPEAERLPLLKIQTASLISTLNSMARGLTPKQAVASAFVVSHLGQLIRELSK